MAVLTESLEVLEPTSRLCRGFGGLPPELVWQVFETDDIGVVRANLDQLTVVLPTRDDPYAPTQQIASLLAETTSVRGFVPAIPPLWIQTLERRIEGLSGELVTTRSADQLLSKGSTATEPADRDGGVCIDSSDAIPDFGLIAFDHCIGVIGVDDRRRIRSLLEVSRSCSAVEAWASERIAGIQ